MFAHYRAITVTLISREYIEASGIEIDLHNSKLQVMQRYVSIDRILARWFDNYLTFLYKGEGKGKFYLKGIVDKQRIFDACFLVDSVLRLECRVFYHSFALLGELV